MKLLYFGIAFSCYARSIVIALASPTSSKTRTVLVTGGAGYIGSHTCLELLKEADEKYRVIVVDNLDNSSEESLKRVQALTACAKDRLVFRQCDLRDRKGLTKGTKGSQEVGTKLESADEEKKLNISFFNLSLSQYWMNFPKSRRAFILPD